MRFDLTQSKPVPWKNGGGTTRLLAADGTAWRLSLADIERDGPFSTFPGLRRVLTIVSGKGIELTGDGDPLHAGPGLPTTFDGARVLSGHLIDGPTQAFNLMFDPRQVQGRVDPLATATITSILQPSVVFVWAGQVTTGDTTRLGAGQGQSLRAGTHIAPGVGAMGFLITFDAPDPQTEASNDEIAAR